MSPANAACLAAARIDCCVRAAGVRRIVTTDSVRAVAEPGVEVVPVAPLFAAALRAGLR